MYTTEGAVDEKCKEIPISSTPSREHYFLRLAIVEISILIKRLNK
jgi:hypothetical protein